MNLGEAVHYDQTNLPRFVSILSTTVEDEFWIKTNKGMLIAATLFPEDLFPDLMIHHAELENLRTAVKKKEAKIYTFLNESSAWRNS